MQLYAQNCRLEWWNACSNNFWNCWTWSYTRRVFECLERKQWEPSKVDDWILCLVFHKYNSEVCEHVKQACVLGSEPFHCLVDVLFINGSCANNRGYQILTLYSNLLIFCLIMRKSFSVILLNNQVNCLFRCRQKGVSWENIWQISAEKKQHKIQKMCRFWHFDDRNSGSLSVGIFRFLF